MQNSSVNQPILILTEIKDDGGIVFPRTYNQDSIVSDMLKSLITDVSNKIYVVPISYDMDMDPSINNPELSKEDEIKALEDAIAQTKELEKQLEDQLVQVKSDETDGSDGSDELVAVNVFMETTSSLSTPSSSTTQNVSSTPQNVSSTPENVSSTMQTFSNVDKFENILSSSKLSWFLVVIVILLLLFLLNDYYKIIKF